MREGVAAWLDVRSTSGTVTSELEQASAPDDGDDAVEIRGRTRSGNIRVHRA